MAYWLFPVYLEIVVISSSAFKKHLHMEFYLKQVSLASYWLQRMEEMTRPKITHLSGEYFPCVVYLVLKMDIRYLKTQTSQKCYTAFVMKCVVFIFNWMKTCFKTCYLIIRSWWKTKQLFFLEGRYLCILLNK